MTSPLAFYWEEIIWISTYCNSALLAKLSTLVIVLRLLHRPLSIVLYCCQNSHVSFRGFHRIAYARKLCCHWLIPKIKLVTPKILPEANLAKIVTKNMGFLEFLTESIYLIEIDLFLFSFFSLRPSMLNETSVFL